MIRVANAPCSWGVLEFDRAATSAPYQQVLDEIREAGYAGTELGDWGFMPTDPSRLGEETRARGLALVGAFVPIAFANPDAHRAGRDVAIRTARLLRDAGAADAFIVLSDDNGAVPAREQNAGRIRPEHALSPDQWRTFSTGVDTTARAVADAAGVRCVFHPHCGGYIETTAEIDELMARTDPETLGLVLDTGHILYGGGDPREVLEGHASRVRHVHFKDCDPVVAARARSEGLGYLDAVRQQLFCELGAGAIDFGRIISVLTRQGYDGWVVVEQDVFPNCGTPLESARRSREFLAALGI